MMIESTRRWLSDLPRSVKRLALVGFDCLTLSGSVWLSYVLRYGEFFEPRPQQWLVISMAPVIAVPIFIRFGLYRAVIRYLPERAIWTMLQAMTLAALAWVGGVFLTEMAGNGVVPRSVPFFYWMVGALAIIGSRFAAKRFFWASAGERIEGGQIVIYGAGEAGSQLATAIRGQGRRIIAGFIDNDPALHGRDVAGHRVFAPSYISALIGNYGVKEVILTMPSISIEERKAIVAELAQYPIKIRTLPPISDLLTGKYLVNQIREIDIDELLGRSSVPADTGLLDSMVRGKRILVTGAGGSIGAELCLLISRLGPVEIVLYEQNEFSLYQIDRRLVASGQATVIPVLASINDAETLKQCIRDREIDVLFHAAAYKHVPLVEANVLEGIRNNVFGSLTVTRTAFEAGVKNFVLISSDKAVRPTNVMGATKRWAELIMRYYAGQALSCDTGQRFSAVRFGNVLGSNGSVVPLFAEQIKGGGPITITHPEMTRYFMSIHEAAELIVQAGAMSQGGDIFLLEMGSPVKILDLARNMIQLAGQTVKDGANPGGDIEISVVGSRPGEKLFEELFYDKANAEKTDHPKILRAAPKTKVGDIHEALAGLEQALRDRDAPLAQAKLFSFIAEF